MTEKTYIDDYPNNIYKTLWLNNRRYNITLLNLVNLADRDETTRQAIAGQGGKASGKARLLNAINKQYVIYYLEQMHAKEQVHRIINGYAGRHKNKIDINNIDSINKYLPLRLLSKLNAINNKLIRQQQRLKRIAERNKAKYNQE